MKCLIQRVKYAKITVDKQIICSIDEGILAYIGFCDTDDMQIVDYVMDRLSKIRIFKDDKGQLNRSLSDVGARVMLVPNFTLYADTTTGRRPSFTKAREYHSANELFDYACSVFDKINCERAERGVFGADMQISCLADGPINIIIER